MSLDRSISYLLIAFCLGMYFFIIPNQIEPPYLESWITPATMPNLSVLGIIPFALWQFFENKNGLYVQQNPLYKSILYAVLGMVFLYFMEIFGFLITAPILCVAAMLVAGEKKLTRLSIGLVCPIIFWLLVTNVFERTLP